ncbi:hypothetical protein [Peribacillus alkalitolerans]|uniref:hypothetical protein n=1 Tax=Peribacillus alkalitolerans TaxID=1550385 RepID=UPI0013D26CBB|nr:hypothetical protein [Peribacillus alkalitolerans]
MKKWWKFLLIGVGALLFWIVFYSNLIRYPVGMTNLIVGIEAEPTYIPFEYQNSYATIRSCGKRCDILNLNYLGTNKKLVIIATDYVSWADDPKWDKNKKIPRTDYYYQNKNGKQQLNWKDNKEELELGIEFTGEMSLPKEELIKLANSIKVEGKKLD